MEPAKVLPAAAAATTLSGVSREDVRNTLHTFFRSKQAPTARRARVYSFVQVQKRKVSLANKRLFASSGGPSKYYILCVSVQDGANPTAQLHYMQFLRSLAVELRQSWDIGRLDVIENNGLTSEKKRGSFSLFFDGEDAPWQWLVDDRESKTAMLEFLWSLCALAVEQKKMLPRLLRFNLEELHETALLLNLQKKYGIDVDLLDHMSTVKKQRSEDEENDNQRESGSNIADTSDGSAGPTSKREGESTEKRGITGANVRLTDAENADADALLANINWADAHLGSIEDNLRRKLRGLEDENISFLLSFEGLSQSSPLNGGVGHGSTSSSTTAVDRIVAAIDSFQLRVAQTQQWTDESDEFLQQTSANMMHFEALNNQLEVHFRNSVTLQEALEAMMARVEIGREQMGVLLKPIAIFPDDATDNSDGANSNPMQLSLAPSAKKEVEDQLKATLVMLKCVDEAIKSTKEYPASEMAAFRARGDELAKLVRGFNDKLCAAFDALLQRKTRQWTVQSMTQAAARAGGSSSLSPPSRTRVTMSAARESRDVSSANSSSSSIIARGSIESSRFSRAITSFETEPVREMDWSFTNEHFHNLVRMYQPLMARLLSLDPQVVIALRSIYAKNTAAVYNPHVHSLFRCLKDKLPKNSKHHFSKPQALQSWSFHLSSTHLGDALGASALMQQALDHIIPIILREQELVSSLFFPDSKGKEEPEELSSVMDAVFDKMLKRMIDFGEAATARNVLDALALVVLVNGQLDTYRDQSEFLFNTVVTFQLQMKRVLIKFTEDQEIWINNHHPDTRMVGVLSPIQKTMTMVGRLEESVCGKTDDNTLATIYHRIMPATIQWLEKVADSKPKYASLVRLENYFFISEKLLSINGSPDLPLGQYASQTRIKFEESAGRYVAYIWVYEFKQLEPLFARLEELLATLPAQEIQYHTPRQDVRKALEVIAPSFEKSVRNMHTRMKKHFTVQPKTVPMVWKQLVDYGCARLRVYEQVSANCYQLRFEPTPQRGAELLNKFST